MWCCFGHTHTHNNMFYFVYRATLFRKWSKGLVSKNICTLFVVRRTDQLWRVCNNNVNDVQRHKHAHTSFPLLSNHLFSNNSIGCDKCWFALYFVYCLIGQNFGKIFRSRHTRSKVPRADIQGLNRVHSLALFMRAIGERLCTHKEWLRQQCWFKKHRRTSPSLSCAFLAQRLEVTLNTARHTRLFPLKNTEMSKIPLNWS